MDAANRSSSNGCQNALATKPAKVFIQRDYSQGTVVRFQTKFPRDLEARISPEAFAETINTLNVMYCEAERTNWKSFSQECLGYLTLFLIFACMDSHYEKNLKKIRRYVQQQNENVYEPAGLHIVDPIERGLRVIEITIFNERFLQIET